MTGNGSQTYRPPFCRPSWLQATLTDLEGRMQSLVFRRPEEENTDSFAKRAENYYRKQPQLLNLLQDLYSRYVSLADRYCQCLKQQAQSPSSIHCDGKHYVHKLIDHDSDNESSLSYQPPHQFQGKPLCSVDNSIVSELVSRTVDNELLQHGIEFMELQLKESCRKMELQMSLVEVLESERLVLLSENARLGLREAAIAEENNELVAEAAFLKRKVSGMAQCLVKMRDDHNVCFLSSKIHDLQARIHELEKQNKRYQEQMSKRKGTKKVLYCQLERMKREEGMMKEVAVKPGEDRGKVSKWWDRLRKVDLMVACGPKSERWR